MHLLYVGEFGCYPPIFAMMMCAKYNGPHIMVVIRGVYDKVYEDVQVDNIPSCLQD